MALEVRLGGGHAFYAGRALVGDDVHDPVDHQEGMAVRQRPHDSLDADIGEALPLGIGAGNIIVHRAPPGAHAQAPAGAGHRAHPTLASQAQIICRPWAWSTLLWADGHPGGATPRP